MRLGKHQAGTRYGCYRMLQIWQEHYYMACGYDPTTSEWANQCVISLVRDNLALKCFIIFFKAYNHALSLTDTILSTKFCHFQGMKQFQKTVSQTPRFHPTTTIYNIDVELYQAVSQRLQAFYNRHSSCKAIMHFVKLHSGQHWF